MGGDEKMVYCEIVFSTLCGVPANESKVSMVCQGLLSWVDSSWAEGFIQMVYLVPPATQTSVGVPSYYPFGDSEGFVLDILPREWERAKKIGRPQRDYVAAGQF